VKSQKQGLVEKYRRSTNDTGSAEVQVALLSKRISSLTEHFKTHVKDHHSRKSLIQLVNKRRSLLNYLKSRSLDRYRTLIESLSLRK
jgi:small subunit ribosomal protein S15